MSQTEPQKLPVYPQPFLSDQPAEPTWIMLASTLRLYPIAGRDPL